MNHEKQDGSDKPVVLVVDDAVENIDFLKGLLEADYKIKAAVNGEIALKIAQTAPDLILLDVQMPGKSGFAVCRELKEDPDTADIPVIFVTSHNEEEAISRGFELGSVDYVTKPYNPSELKARIKTHLELKFSREKLAVLAQNLGKYLSPELFNSIFRGEKQIAITSSRKTLTVFFSDIVQFTPRVESMDENEVSVWLNNYLNKMAEIAIKHGGTLDKFIGDAVMVFFGDPLTQGEQKDAVACVDMAKEMIAAAEALDIDIRIGISTGDCTVGNFGSENHMEYSILGKEVNVAARLESNSEPNRILVSESTQKLIANEHACHFNDKLTVKGIERPIPTYWVD